MNSDILGTQFRWPALARDLAIMQTPDSPIDLTAIYQEYGLTPESLKAILLVPRFQLLFQQSLAECKEQGSKAGARYRAMTLSQALLEKMFRDAHQGVLDGKDALKLLELMMRAAGLLDTKEQPMVQVNTQTNVSVPLPLPRGVPKVAHCLPAD